jgi:hypothetical protein
VPEISIPYFVLKEYKESTIVKKLDSIYDEYLKNRGFLEYANEPVFNTGGTITVYIKKINQSERSESIY